MEDRREYKLAPLPWTQEAQPKTMMRMAFQNCKVPFTLKMLIVRKEPGL